MGESKQPSTFQLMQQVIGTTHDHEWYPTTDSIIAIIKNDIDKHQKMHDPVGNYGSVLDCGAGDGRVLKALTKGKMYAIEKSRPLLDVLDKKIFVVGTEFQEQTLLDKKVSIIFSNPPYSEYEIWAEKIIREGNANKIYLVIPKRWRKSQDIQHAIEMRDASTEILGSFDFLTADRKARAVVDIVKIDLCFQGGHCKNTSKTDPFQLWFQEHFKIEISNNAPSKHNLKNKIQKELAANKSTQNQLVKGNNIVGILEQMYQRDLDNLLKTYQGLTAVDSEILGELDVNLKGVQEALELKVVGLKDLYWEELFSNLHKVTDRLTVKSRTNLLKTLTEHTHVDFTTSNAHAVLGWIVKQSNNYFDEQLIETVENMTEKANIKLYKSNERTFGNEEWHYTRRPKNLDNFSLEYRIVVASIGGIYDSESYYTWKHVNNLTQSAADHINDLCTIASNIGFDTTGLERANSFEWESNKMKTFQYRDITTGELHTLFDVRAFKNGNLHFKYNQKFMCKLNCEFGRLKGWIKSPKQAAEEMDIPFEVAQASFNSNLQLEDNSLLKLGFESAA